MTNKIPICDQLSHHWTQRLSSDTKRRIYEDCKAYLPDQAIDCMEADSIEHAYDMFSFMFFWQIQHQLLNGIMSDDEIEQRIYSQSGITDE